MSEDPGRRARDLVRRLDRGALGTADAEGWPHASLVLYATDAEGCPLLLISRLAEHTRNLAAGPRCSLLVDGTAGLDSPLTGPRVTLSGRADPTEDPAHRARFLARHPEAQLYAGFADFALWRIAVERAHLVAGFGAIHRLSAPDVLTPPEPALAAAEPGIVAHMNDDHADALDAYAGGLLGLSGTGWRMTGIDPEGIDLRRGGAVARLGFDRRVTSPEEARAELVRLARQARAG